jgi:phosphate/sulfate permease
MLEGFEVSLAGIVSSLILVPIRSGLRGFCLFIFLKHVFDYRQNNPLKHNACLLFLYRKVSDVAQPNSAYRWIWY